MIQYIPKDALIAEIDRLEKKLYYEPENFKDVGAKMALDSLKSSLDTLEVKEVDNVWHDANETPKGAGDKEILVQFSDWHTSVLEIDDWEYLDHQTKWAYLKDLI